MLRGPLRGLLGAREHPAVACSDRLPAWSVGLTCKELTVRVTGRCSEIPKPAQLPGKPWRAVLVRLDPG